jgi:hypothetical protein
MMRTKLSENLGIMWWSSYGDSGREGLNVYAGKRTVEVYISPTGRSVVVYVDGRMIPRLSNEGGGDDG